MQELTLSQDFYKVGFLLKDIIQLINNSFDDEPFKQNKLHIINSLFNIESDYERYISNSIRREFNNSVIEKNKAIVNKIRGVLLSIISTQTIS